MPRFISNKSSGDADRSEERFNYSHKQLNSKMSNTPPEPCWKCGKVFETKRALECHKLIHRKRPRPSVSPSFSDEEMAVAGEENPQLPLQSNRKSPELDYDADDEAEPPNLGAGRAPSSPIDFEDEGVKAVLENMEKKFSPGKEKFPHKCSKCDMRFSSKPALDGHRRIHKTSPEVEDMDEDWTDS